MNVATLIISSVDSTLLVIILVLMIRHRKETNGKGDMQETKLQG